MKKLVFASLLGLVGICTGASAGSTNSTFSVTLTLTPSCSVSKTADATLTYTANTAASSATASAAAMNVTCTNALPYTLALDGTGASGVYTYSDAHDATNNPNGLDLSYTLTLSATGSTGTGSAQSFNITPAIASSGWGRCAAASAGANCQRSFTRTLTVSY